MHRYRNLEHMLNLPLKVLFWTVAVLLWVGTAAIAPSAHHVRTVIEGVRFVSDAKREQKANGYESLVEGCPLANYHFRRGERNTESNDRATELLLAMRILRDEGFTDEELRSPEVTEEFRRQTGGSCETDDVTCDENAKYRTADGTCNNLINKKWGSAGSIQIRLLDPAYDDGEGTQRNTSKSVNGGKLPNPRHISNEIHDARGDPIRSNYINLHAFQMGQFLDHDITLTPTQTSVEDCCQDDTFDDHDNCLPIYVQQNEGRNSFFYKGYCMNFQRSEAKVCVTDDGVVRREQINAITSYIDASNVYGSSLEQQANLRENGGTGAFMRIDDRWLPKDPNHKKCKQDGFEHQECNLAGDERANVVPSLTAYHSLFVMEHNRIASLLRDSYPDDEELFQETRRLLIAIMQKIVYNEFLPSFLSNQTMDFYGLKSDGAFVYDPDLNPTVFNAFGIAYRFGHTWISRSMDIFNSNFRRERRERTEDTYDDLTLTYVNGDPKGPDGLAMWLTGENCAETDELIESAARNFLFKNQTARTSFDLVSLNIQRGRDHGLPSYTEFRKYCNPEVDDVIFFSDLSNHSTEAQNNLARVYADPRDIDLFTGVVTETKVAEHALGPTLECLLGTQFERLKFGDRFWYEGEVANFDDDQLDAINEYSMAKVLCNNYEFTRVNYPNAFLVVDPLEDCEDIPQLDISKFQTVTTTTSTTTTTTTPAPPPPQGQNRPNRPRPGRPGRPRGLQEVENSGKETELEDLLERLLDELDDN